MNLQSGFQPSCEVTDPELLFGHSRPGALLEQLVTQMRLGTNAQLLGERRSGKTSLLKCSIPRLCAAEPRVVPVYLNYRRHHLVKGYALAHRLLLAHVHASAVRGCYGAFPTRLMLRGIELSPSLLPEEHFEKLSSVSDYRIDGLIEAYFHLLGEYGLGVVLLLDEYEHLMQHTFGGQEGAFFHIRTLSSEAPPSRGAPKALTYVVAGALPWNQLCHVIGSPELNNIGVVLPITPLDSEAFRQMWEQCLADSSPAVRQHISMTNIKLDSIYEQAGGWPFYGKVIGQHMSSGSYNEDAIYEALVDHFTVIWSRLNFAERKQLNAVCKGLPEAVDASTQTMLHRGLVEYDLAGRLGVRGQLWSRYVRDQISESATDLKPTVQESNEEKLGLVVDKILDLVAEINESSLNISGEEIFRSSNHDRQIERDLRKSAVDADQFSQFALSLYNLLYERTTGPKLAKVVSSDGKSIVEENRFRPLERLPKKLRRNRSIVKIVDAVRHHFGKGHLTRLGSFNISGNGLKISDVLQQYLGSRANPRDAQFLAMQLGLLNDVASFLVELRNLLDESPEMFCNSSPSSDCVAESQTAQS